MKMILDARMVQMSGIGRYIRLLIPVLKGQFELTLMGDPSLLGDYKAPVIPFFTKIYNPIEQLQYIKRVPKCDILWTPHFNVPVLPVPAKLRISTIYDVFHLTPYANLSAVARAYAGFLLKQAVSRSDAVFTISHFTRDELACYLKLNSKETKKIHVIHLFADETIQKKELSAVEKADTLHRMGIKNIDPEKIVLYVGNVKPHKNIMGLLQAFALAVKKEKNLSLVIVGKKDSFYSGLNNLGAFVESLGINSSVFFTGHISDSDLIDLYSLAHMLAFPTFYEGFGYPPLEAMACGCPVLLSSIPVIREVNHDAGLYVDPSDPEDIAHGMLELSRNNKLRQSLITRGDEVRKEYSRSKFEAEYLKSLAEIVKDSGL